jgi:hypothetical protein
MFNRARGIIAERVPGLNRRPVTNGRKRREIERQDDAERSKLGGAASSQKPHFAPRRRQAAGRPAEHRETRDLRADLPGAVPHPLPVDHAAPLHRGHGPDDRRDRPAGDRRLPGRGRADRLGRRRLSHRGRDHRARLWPARRYVRAEAHDVRGDRGHRCRLARLRLLRLARHADRRAFPAGPRRRRADGPVACACRPVGAAARPRPLPGLFLDHHGEREHGRPSISAGARSSSSTYRSALPRRFSSCASPPIGRRRSASVSIFPASCCSSSSSPRS